MLKMETIAIIAIMLKIILNNLNNNNLSNNSNNLKELIMGIINKPLEISDLGLIGMKIMIIRVIWENMTLLAKTLTLKMMFYKRKLNYEKI